MKKFNKQLTVNYLLNPEKWTRPKVNTERSQMNNTDDTNAQNRRKNKYEIPCFLANWSILFLF